MVWHRLLLSLCAREAMNTSKAESRALEIQICSASIFAWPCIVELLVYRWWTTFQSCSSSLLYTCPTWAPTKPGDEGGVWFPCEKLNNTFSWIWSLPTEEVFFSQSCQQKERVLHSDHEQWACCINYPMFLVVVCQDYASWFAWAWPTFLSVPPWALDSFCFKIRACFRPPWARKMTAASVSVIKSEKLSSMLMAAGLFSIFQQCERKVRSIMHLAPTLLMDGHTRVFFSWHLAC